MAVVAYCVKCKEKKEMVDPQEGVTKNGRVITKGTCPDCGTKMSLIGGVAKKSLSVSFSQAGILHLSPLGSCQRAFLFVRVAHAERVLFARLVCSGSAPAQL